MTNQKNPPRMLATLDRSGRYGVGQPYFGHPYVTQGRALCTQTVYQEVRVPSSCIRTVRGFFHTAPLEIWHITLCLAIGMWIGVIGYSTYDLQLYSSLLRYLSSTFFMLLFLGLSLGGILGLLLPSRRLRRGVAGLAASLWGFAAVYYLIGMLHPMSFPTCAVFSMQQMSVFVRLRAEVYGAPS